MVKRISFNSPTPPHLDWQTIRDAMFGKVEVMWHKQNYLKKLNKNQLPIITDAVSQNYCVLSLAKGNSDLLSTFWYQLCEIENFPVITIERTRRTNLVRLQVDAIVCDWRLSLNDLSSIYKSVIDFKDVNLIERHKPTEKNPIPCSIGFSLQWINRLTFSEAEDAARLLVKYFTTLRPYAARTLCGDPQTDLFNNLEWANNELSFKMPISLKTQSNNQDKQGENMVKLFKDGKALALQTDILNEQEFTGNFANALQDFILGDKFEGVHEIAVFLNRYVEICCKMRGYKADVREQRVLTSGDINPNTESIVTATENGNVQALAVTN